MYLRDPGHHPANSDAGPGRSVRQAARLRLVLRHPLSVHARRAVRAGRGRWRSEEHTSELQSLMRISYAVFCLKKKTTISNRHNQYKQPTTHTTHTKNKLH